jgi:predicted nucleic acid-binding protein
MKDARVFIDTNILVYAYDSTAGRKHKIALELLAGLWRSAAGVVSIQVLQEFYVTVTKKIAKPVDPLQAREIVEDMLSWDVVMTDAELLLEAITLASGEMLSLWDSLIVCAASRSGSDLLLSEDFTNGKVLNGVKIQNPFL